MRGNSWIIKQLPKLLVEDWYNLNIYTEYDLQVSTYHWLRRHFDSKRSIQWIVRAQPTLSVRGGKTVKPDIVIYKNTIPYDVIELKCQMTAFQPTTLGQDLDKLKTLKRYWNIRHAYQMVLYDDDNTHSLPTHRKEEWMKNFLTFIPINVRRNTSGRQRVGYFEARKRWERFK